MFGNPLSLFQLFANIARQIFRCVLPTQVRIVLVHYAFRRITVNLIAKFFYNLVVCLTCQLLDYSQVNHTALTLANVKRVHYVIAMRNFLIRLYRAFREYVRLFRCACFLVHFLYGNQQSVIGIFTEQTAVEF